MAELDINNVSQAAYWSSRVAKAWIEFSDDLEAMQEGITLHLINQAGIDKDHNVLDIAGGLGATTMAISQAIGPNGHVDNIDLSIPLVAHAKETFRQKQIHNAGFIIADAQTHEFKPQFYDRAISRFGMTFFSDPVAAFSNISKAMKHGSKIVFSAWGKIEDNPLFAIPRMMPVEYYKLKSNTRLPSDDRFSFHDIHHVNKIAAQAGLNTFFADNYKVDITPQFGAKRLAEIAIQAGSIPRIVEEQNGNEEDIEIIQDKIADQYRLFNTLSGLTIPASINIFEIRL